MKRSPFSSERISHYALCVPALALCFACGETKSDGPEGASSDATSGVTSSSSSGSTSATSSTSSATSSSSSSTGSSSSSTAGATGGTGSAGGTGSTGGTGDTGGNTGSTSSGGTGDTSSGGTGSTGGAGSSEDTDSTSSSGASDSAGGDSSASGSDSESTSGEPGEFKLTSAEHEDGAVFADEFTCALCGFNGSLMPPLEWTAGPSGTMSYALTFLDTKILTDADPNNDNLAMHWAMWDIPAATLSLEKGMTMATAPAKQTGAFLGPCPSFTATATDTYEMTLYAIPTATITVAMATSVESALAAIEEAATASVKLTGTSSASPAQQPQAGCN